LQAKYYGYKGSEVQRFWVQGSRFRVQGSGFNGSGFKVQRFMVQSSRFSVVAGCGAAGQIEKKLLKSESSRGG
jgi:hypothetical protein